MNGALLLRGVAIICATWGALWLSIAQVNADRAPLSYTDYQQSLKTDCDKDNDCEVKNVGNCCGYYPACVNKTAKADPALVKQLCEKAGIMSVCGWVDISGCKCVEKRCIAMR